MARALTLLALFVAVIWTASSCGVPPTDACIRYVECQNAYDEEFGILPDQGGVDTTDFEPGGDCWADASTSQTCTDSCTRAIESLRTAAVEAGSDLQACN